MGEKFFSTQSYLNVVENQYETQMADELFNEMKILCFVNTYPKNHRTKAIFVKQTWGKRCNKLLFVTNQEDPELDTIVLNVDNTRRSLRNRTRETFLLVHKEYLNDFDWFLKADDDT